jgi:hypothetical protein
LVTTARFTSLLNCALALARWSTRRSGFATSTRQQPQHWRIGLADPAEKRGNRRWSADILHVCARVNCQPSSEPMQATTASAMISLPTQGWNICA